MKKDETQNQSWPMPKFYFQVDFGSVIKNATFQEVSGLDSEEQILEYKHDGKANFSPIKMPGIVKYGNIFMKRGEFVNNNEFWKWYDEISMNTIKRMTVLIKLLDEKGNPTIQWELQNAWPTKITGADLNSNEDKIRVESFEITHEKLTMIKV